MRSINHLPYRNHHSRSRRWWRRRRRRYHDGLRLHHDRRRCNNRRRRRHHNRRRCHHNRRRCHNRRCRCHNRRAVVRIPVGIIPDLPIPTTPVMWMRRRTSPPTAQIRRRHTTMKYVVMRRSTMRTMRHTAVVFRMHRTGPRVVRGMAGRNSPSGTGNETASNGKDDHPFHNGSPFCFSAAKHKRI